MKSEKQRKSEEDDSEAYDTSGNGSDNRRATALRRPQPQPALGARAVR